MNSKEDYLEMIYDEEIIYDESFKWSCLFETCSYIDVDNKKHIVEYYKYDINTDILKEITEEEYRAYKEKGAWSNLVLNKQHIEKMIENSKNISAKKIKINTFEGMM